MGRGIDDPTFTQPASPIIRFTPPVGPVQEGGFQKLKEIVRDERLRESQQSGHTDNSPKDKEDEFGKIVASPPAGLDGRAAHKSIDLMTPFEKIRFGHADELLDQKGSQFARLRKNSAFQPQPYGQDDHDESQLENEEEPLRPELVQFTPYTSTNGLVDYDETHLMEQEDEPTILTVLSTE